MGILDGYPFNFGGNNGDPYGGGGILGMLMQNMPNLPQPGQQPQGFPQQAPTDVSAVNRNGTSGVTLPDVSASGFGRDGGGGNPFASLFGGLGDAVGGLFGQGGQQAPPAQMGAPRTPQMPQQAPQGPGIGDRLGAGWQGLGNGGLTSAIGGLFTGQRQDPQGLMERALIQRGVSPDMARAGVKNPQLLPTLLAEQPQAATAHALYQGLLKTGRYSPEEAQGIAMAASTNPALATALLPQAFGSKYEAKTVKGPLGDETIQAFNPVTGTVKSAGQGGGADAAPGGPTMLAPGVKQYNPTLTGDDYMNQFSPEVQSVAKMFLRGDQMPTGNPRLQGIIPFAKTVATKYSQDMGTPFSDVEYAKKRKMQTDLAASSNNSMGGIISNGASAFDHLTNLSDKLVDLGSLNGPNVYGGGYAGQLGNTIGSALGTSETKAKLTAANNNALKYGQEATKFYAGSGGGEAERMHALKTMNPESSTANEQAAFLETEKQLMLGRLQEKENQIRDTLGDDYLQRHPVLTPQLQKTIGHLDQNIAKLRGEAAPGQQGGQLPKVTTQAEWSKLQKGTQYIAPDGSTRTKQ